MQFRIGDRDPVTGLYNVIWPDGSSTLNGVKIFNAAHAVGDVVLATQRSDGMMILDSAKAVSVSTTITNDFGLVKFGEKPTGYLAGQVFNNEDEPILPIVSVEFAPGSPTELAPGNGLFTIRIATSRAQNRDLRVLCEFTGTASSNEYTINGINDSVAGERAIIILAGQQFIDITIEPTTGNQPVADETIIISLATNANYRLGYSFVTATIKLPPTTVSLIFDGSTIQNISTASYIVRAELSNIVNFNVLVQCDLSGTLSPANINVIGASVSGSILSINIPAGQLFTEFIVTPIFRRIIADEYLNVVINPLMLDPAISVGIPIFQAFVSPSPIRIRVKVYPRVVENPVLFQGVAVSGPYTSIYERTYPYTKPLTFSSNTNFTDMVLTVTGNLQSVAINYYYSDNDLNPMLDNSVVFNDLISGPDLVAITNTFNSSFYGSIVDFDAIAASNSTTDRYIYLCSRENGTLLGSPYKQNSYATASCETSDTQMQISAIEATPITARFSTKYQPLPNEVSQKIGYVEQNSRGTIRRFQSSGQTYIDDVLSAWIVKLDTNDMSVSFVNPVIQVAIQASPGAVVIDRTTQIVYA